MTPVPDQPTAVLRILEAHDELGRPALLHVRDLAGQVGASSEEIRLVCQTLEHQHLIKCVYGRGREDNPGCEITTFGRMVLERLGNAGQVSPTSATRRTVM